MAISVYDLSKKYPKRTNKHIRENMRDLIADGPAGNVDGLQLQM